MRLLVPTLCALLAAPTGAPVERTIRKQIEELVQLNEGQPYAYDRTALINMLDEALTTAQPRTKILEGER